VVDDSEQSSDAQSEARDRGADKLARLALEQKEPLHKNMAFVRKEILINSSQTSTNF
jgi:hypothetical protein